MGSGFATLDDMLALLPTLGAPQVSIVAVVDTTDGPYQVQLEALAPATYNAAGASAVVIRDALAGDLEPLADGLAVVDELDLIQPPTTAIKLTGLELGRAFAVGVASPADGLEVTTTPAAGVPQATLERYLALASRLVSSTKRWRDLLCDGQALRALHLLSRAGVLSNYGIDDDGEAGPVVADALGPASTSWAAMAQAEGDPSLTHTRWGRMYLELALTVHGQGSAVGAW